MYESNESVRKSFIFDRNTRCHTTVNYLYWSLSVNKSPQVSGTLLSILADLNNVVVRMVSIHSFISKSSGPFINPLVTVPRAPITIGLLSLLLLLLLLLFTPLEFFTSVLADGFSLEFEWQQVSSSLLDLSQDSGRSQQCFQLDSLYPSANFQVLQAFSIL